jgi:hypothetical protein
MTVKLPATRRSREVLPRWLASDYLPPQRWEKVDGIPKAPMLSGVQRPRREHCLLHPSLVRLLCMAVA